MAEEPADLLTSLQTTYDQLLNQFFSTISYLSQRHPLIPPTPDPNEPFTRYPPPSQDPTSATDLSPSAQSQNHIWPQPGPEDTDPTKTTRPLRPDPPALFAASQAELAEDLILKAAQIGELIDQLPDSSGGEEEQAEKIRALVEQVREVEGRRKQARKEVRRLVKDLDRVVSGMSENVGGEFGPLTGGSVINGVHDVDSHGRG